MKKDEHLHFSRERELDQRFDLSTKRNGIIEVNPENRTKVLTLK